MKTAMVGKTQKENRRRLLPLLGLVAGLAVPVYAYAGSEAACNWCHYSCDSWYQSTYSVCYGYPVELQQSCFNSLGAQLTQCHMNCQSDPAYCAN